MEGTFSSLVPIALGLFAIAMALYGGMSFGFYHFGGSWTGLSFLAGLFVILAILIRSSRGFFNRFAGRINFALFLIAVLGAYFVFLFQEGKYPMGIDLAGGTELIYRLDYARADENIARTNEALVKAKAEDPDSKETKNLIAQIQNLEQSKKTAPDKAAEVVRRRIDPTGTKGIPVTTLGANRDRLRIQLPKATPQEVERIKNAIQTRGRLAFHIVTDDQPLIQQVQQSKAVPKVSTDGVWEEKVIETQNQISAGKSEDKIVVRRVPDMDGSHVALAVARPSHESASWEIGLSFDATGGVEFGQLTQRSIKKRMAIVLDDIAKSAPTIQEQINSECRISGNFDQKQAEELAAVLTAGSLPAEVKSESEIQVGPSLGQEQISSGMLATVIGTGVVIVFMLLYYRFSGLVASLCMLLNLPMLLGAMGFFKATLTLPGIAGIVLTLGMAVDANVLIIERLREELARGRSLKQAVQHGFDRAFLTIIDCHSTTLISSIILYYLGTGPVRGFAVSLSVGILTTLFCNLWLNWLIMDWLVSRDAVPSMHMMQFFKETKIDFMGQRRAWMIITGALALGSCILFAIDQNDLYDVDFTGGTRIQFNFARGKSKNQDEVRKTIETKIADQLKTKEAAVLGKQQVELQVQSFGKPEEGTKDKFRSYTVTTRITDTAAIEELGRELIAEFKADLEPDAVTLTDNRIDVRLNEAAGLTTDSAKKRVDDAIAAAAKESGDPEVQPALAALKAIDVKQDSGYYLVELGPLPADPKIRDKAVTVVAATKIDDRADGAISRKDAFGAQVAGEMWKQALLALILANAAVFIYIWFRFEFSGAWGFGAIVALIHDTVIATGGVVLAHMLGFPLRIDLNIVAALLTITGFSVNDTIVVFDRIREVKAAHPTRSYEEIVNEAINATLSRTILTSLTVLMADAALLIFGGPTIRGMAYTLLVGFAVGTYSSIFIASPLMIWWYRTFGGGKAAVPATTVPKSKDAVNAQI